MAKKRKRAKKRAPAVRGLLLILAACLLVALGVLLGAYLERRSAAAQARAQGVAHYSSTIARNSYQFDGFQTQNGRTVYEDAQYTSITGVDVSDYQGSIDWTAVAQDGISFAILKIGYRGYVDGALHEDTQFAANWDGAVQAGLPVGVYFFSQATSEEEARQEAAYVLEILGDRSLDYPIFFNWEPVETENSRTAAMDLTCVSAITQAFCDAIAAGGRQAGFYFNRSFLYSYLDLTQLQEYPLWLAQYQSAPDYIFSYCAWQYTDSGQVRGIETPVDLSIYFVPRE